jgi:formylglycine-generating enzyme required for sulfatase activity
MGSTLEQFEVIKNKRYREWVEKSEPPQRTITLPDYRIGKYPVTVEEYREFVEGGGYHEQKWWTQAGWQQREKDGWTEPLYWGRTMYFGDDRYPISGISWYEAYAYCQWLSEETGKLYRLPNEAAWEKAARGADGRAYPWGPRWRKGVCNTRELRRVGPTPVGEFSPMGDSPYGLADMSGNVREWCVSRWFDQYVYPENDDPQGNVTRSYRSGSWLDYSPHVRCAFRRWAYPDHRDEEMGFRIAMSLPD